MTKKTPISNLNKNDARLNEICLDAETMAIIDAQCEEHKTNRAKFIAVVVRLFLDFSYIARTVGKDIFSFRDEMIKAIVRSKGNTPEKSGGDIFETISSAGKESVKESGGSKFSAAEGLDIKGFNEKFRAMAGELSELRAAFLELKGVVSLAVKNAAGSSRDADDKRMRECNQSVLKVKDKKIDEISIDELAGEFKNSLPPSYKDKRKKLHKLKF
jgi:hypothetical protein